MMSLGSYRHDFITLISFVLMAVMPAFEACTGFSGPPPPLFAYDESGVLAASRSMLKDAKQVMYADVYISAPIDADTIPLWISPDGIDEQAGVLISYLLGVESEGLSPDFFKVKMLSEQIDSLRSWGVEGSTYALPDSIAVALETELTRSLVRYAYGQRYGYVRPHKLFNRLLVDGDAIDKTKTTYREIFGIDCDLPTDSLAYVAVQSVRNGNLKDFLASIQPDTKLHKALSDEYKRAVAQKDTARIRLARINLERSRWRYQRPDSGRYVFVNLAPQMLTAFDADADTCIQMRVCCGNQGHKTPLLSSEISYMEFNPYWIVPQTIIRNEIATAHVHDEAYFSRNHMIAIHNSRHDTVNPADLTAEQWRSAAYTLRQDKGSGNSLGRIIFRFPNKYAVYLHDTNQPGVFQRDNRAVSHGCVRVQRPMELAEFLLGDSADSVYIDRIRMSIDLSPRTQRGKELLDTDPKPEPLKRHTFKSKIPVFIDYYTLYPDTGGKMHDYRDSYGYDKVLDDALKTF